MTDLTAPHNAEPTLHKASSDGRGSADERAAREVELRKSMPADASAWNAYPEHFTDTARVDGNEPSKVPVADVLTGALAAVSRQAHSAQDAGHDIANREIAINPGAGSAGGRAYIRPPNSLAIDHGDPVWITTRRSEVRPARTKVGRLIASAAVDLTLWSGHQVIQTLARTQV